MGAEIGRLSVTGASIALGQIYIRNISSPRKHHCRPAGQIYRGDPRPTSPLCGHSPQSVIAASLTPLGLRVCTSHIQTRHLRFTRAQISRENVRSSAREQDCSRGVPEGLFCQLVRYRTSSGAALLRSSRLTSICASSIQGLIFEWASKMTRLLDK